MTVACQEAVDGFTASPPGWRFSEELTASMRREEDALAMLGGESAKPGGQEGISEIMAASLKSFSQESGPHQAETGFDSAYGTLEDEAAIA